MTLGGPEGVILLALVLILFGGSQLPKLARNLGRAQKEFRDGMQEATGADEEPGAEVPDADRSGS